MSNSLLSLTKVSEMKDKCRGHKKMRRKK